MRTPMKKTLLTLFCLVLLLPLGAGEARSLFSYTHVKFGLQMAPKVDSLGRKWLMGVEFHRRINPYMAVSFELMPFYRNCDELDSTLLAGYGFVNLKAGYKPVNHFGFYGGFGAGGRVARTWADVDEQSFSRTSLDWGWQAVAGLTFQQKSFSLLVEYHRLVEKLADLGEPNVRHFLMFGFGF